MNTYTAEYVVLTGEMMHPGQVSRLFLQSASEFELLLASSRSDIPYRRRNHEFWRPHTSPHGGAIGVAQHDRCHAANEAKIGGWRQHPHNIRRMPAYGRSPREVACIVRSPRDRESRCPHGAPNMPTQSVCIWRRVAPLRYRQPAGGSRTRVLG